jgi:hypothetical protein
MLMGDSCRSAGRNSLTDTRPRIERPQNRPTITTGKDPDGSPFPKLLKLLAGLIVWRRSPLLNLSDGLSNERNLPS